MSTRRDDRQKRTIQPKKMMKRFDVRNCRDRLVGGQCDVDDRETLTCQRDGSLHIKRAHHRSLESKQFHCAK
jgi:hypothetical protein